MSIMKAGVGGICGESGVTVLDDALSNFFFFFSSRRRHTRFDCDWSSDVCSSDLADQRWDRYDLRVDPSAAVRRYVDGFGNAAHLVTIARPHGFVEVTMHGEEIGRASCRERV